MESRTIMFKNENSNEKKPLVSIVMSAYNPMPHFFRRAIDSIRNQTLEDWEFIICDDCSGEKCGKFLKSFESTDPRIKVIRNRINSGLAVSLNKCVAHSEGRYIARMDDDDVSLPQRLEKQVAFLERHSEFSWVGCNTGLLNDNERYGERRVPECPEATDYLQYCPYIHPSVMFRRSVFDRNGGYRKFRRGEDYEFFMRLHSLGLRGYNMQEELFLYREAPHTSRRRGYYYQLEEMGIRLRGFKELDLLTPGNMVYVIKPMITGLISYKQRIKIKRMLGR